MAVITVYNSMHQLTAKILSALLLAIAVTLLVLKTMTAVVLFSDDPTNLLVVKAMPSWSNRLQDAEPSQYWIQLLSDENGFIGFTLYQFLVGHAATILIVLALLLTAVTLTSRRALTKGHAN